MRVLTCEIHSFLRAICTKNLFAASCAVQKRGVKFQSSEEKAKLPIYQYALDNERLRNRVYVWGYTRYGALGKREFVKPRGRKRAILKRITPAVLEFSFINSVKDVACGYGFTVMVVDSHKSEYHVFGTGLNTDSQIGYHTPRRGHPLEQLLEFAPIDVPLKDRTKVKQASCGRAHTLINTNKEGVFSLGNNSYGQCGRPVVENEEYKGNPRIHRVSIDEEVQEVICGQDTSFLITKSKEVFSCGWGADGQLGNGQFKNEWNPMKVRGDIEGEKILKVSCAADCALAVSDKGDVFGWGNSEYGQLLKAATNQQLNISRHVALPKECGKIVDVAAAGCMCAVLNEKGEVFVWGYGLLGKGPEAQQITQPALIPHPLFGCNEFNPDSKVISIACGLNHFAAITNNGDLYMWGHNKTGCLGLGFSDDQYFPLRVSVPAKVAKISCGVDHTFVLCKSLA